MIKAVLFDLDGTLLPMNEDEFKKRAFQYALHKLFMKAHEQRARKQDGDRENMDGCYQEK